LPRPSRFRNPQTPVGVTFPTPSGVISTLRSRLVLNQTRRGPRTNGAYCAHSNDFAVADLDVFSYSYARTGRWFACGTTNYCIAARGSAAGDSNVRLLSPASPFPPPIAGVVGSPTSESDFREMATYQDTV
jgi:hypothetical protein